MNQDYIVLINPVEYSIFINDDSYIVLITPVRYDTLIGEW